MFDVGDHHAVDSGNRQRSHSYDDTTMEQEELVEVLDVVDDKVVRLVRVDSSVRFVGWEQYVQNERDEGKTVEHKNREGRVTDLKRN